MNPAPTDDASEYDPTTGKIGYALPRILPGLRAPQWLNSVLSMDKQTLLTEMDMGAPNPIQA
jgi:hypothetical protein